MWSRIRILFPPPPPPEVIWVPVTRSAKASSASLCTGSLPDLDPASVGVTLTLTLLAWRTVAVGGRGALVSFLIYI